MNTEIIKIIEGGLKNDRSKVYKFALQLSKNALKTDNKSLSRRIETLLKNQARDFATTDDFLVTPVDTDSRLDIAEIISPGSNSNSGDLIFPSLVTKRIDDFLKGIKKREQIIDFGLELNNSLLLYGPPGCGKSSAAQHIATTLNLPLVKARLDAVISSLLGSTAKNIKKLFDFAADKPCVLFLDEFDAIAKARDDSHELGELKRVVNSLIQNIDEFAENNILIAATNHEKLLDKAIWRRFKTIIHFPNVGAEERRKIVELYLKSYLYDFSADSKKWAIIINLLEGHSPSDIRNIVENAIRGNILKDKTQLTYSELLYEIMIFKRGVSLSNENAAKFLNENGATQDTIKELLDLSSVRQVRNLLMKQTL